MEERTDGPGATPSPDEALTVLREISARLGTMEQRLTAIEASLRPAAAPPRPPASPAAPRPAAPVPPAHGAPPVPGVRPQPPLTGPAVPAPAPGQFPGAAPPVPQAVTWRPGARPPVPSHDGHLPPPPAPARLETGTENRVGKYLLSGAAALLVLLSAATLIAMWWDAIPDLVKVSTVFVIGVVLTVIGTWLAIRRPGSVLHAATVTGIGGGLGFVGLMGASLLHLVAPVPSFAALSVWTLVLLGLAARTRLVFTIVIAALGGVATTALAAGQAAEYPDEALLALLLMVAYAGATSLTSAVVVRSVPPTLRPVYLMAPLLLIITTAALLPIETAHWIFEPGVLAGVGLLLVILIGHILVLTSAAHRASPPPPDTPGPESRPAAARRPTQWAACWLSVPLVPVLLVSRPGGLGSALNLDAFSYLILAVLGVAALAQTLLASLRAASGDWAGHCLFAAALLAGPIGIHLGSERTPLLLGATLLVALLAELPVLLAGHQSGVWAFGVLVFVMGALLSDRWLLAAVILAAALAAIGVALVVDRRSGGNGAVRATSVLVAALLVWRIPAAIGSVADGLALSTQQAMTLNWSLSALAFVVLAALGLGAGLHGPVDLLTGRFAGARAVIVPPALPGGTYRSSSQSSWVLAALMWVWSWQLVPLADWDFWDETAPGEQVQRLVLAAALLALAVAFVWLLAPLVALPLNGLATAAGGTWFMVLATCLASRSDAAGVPAGIAMLVAGALSIVLGFRQKARAVRLYGLVLVIVMVLKFAFWDISAQSSLARVVALLIGGLICFALSVLYARADAQWGTAPGPSDPPPPGAPQAGHPGTPSPGTHPAVPQGGARWPHDGPTRV